MLVSFPLFFFKIPPHIHFIWGERRAFFSIFLSAASWFQTSQSGGLLPATSCFLCCWESNRRVWLPPRGSQRRRCSHSELSDSLRLWKGVTKPRREKQTKLVFLSPRRSQSHLFPHSPVSLSYRTCKYHWFLFFLFLLFITELFISYFPHPVDEAVLVYAFL